MSIIVNIFLGTVLDFKAWQVVSSESLYSLEDAVEKLSVMMNKN